MNISMWSGPRNLSTAMMYAFAARGDCAVWDEPFYAAYLKKTGLDHPMRDAILAAYDADPARVAAACAGAAPDRKIHFYQKHMAQHMVPGMPLDWADAVTNVFLIRHPARVVASYAKKREGPTEDDLGFRRLAELFDRFATRQGRAPVVIDSTDIRANPTEMLEKLCRALEIPFTEAMLHWPPGPKPHDGAWAPHWYNAVHRSTGFEGAEGPLPDLPHAYADLTRACLPHYEALRAHAL